MSVRVTASITGDETLAAKLGQLVGKAPQAAAAALFQEGERVMAASKLLVPVDTGALRASGHVQPPRVEGTLVRVELGYGGVAGATVGGKYVGYAVYVHENLTAAHPVGKAKYLEEPMLAALPGMGQRIGKALAAGLGLGGL
jgi:hypothetical protein